MKSVLFSALFVSMSMIAVSAHAFPQGSILECRPKYQPVGMSLSVDLYAGVPERAIITAQGRTSTTQESFDISNNYTSFTGQNFLLTVDQNLIGNVHAIFQGQDLQWQGMICQRPYAPGLPK